MNLDHDRHFYMWEKELYKIQFGTTHPEKDNAKIGEQVPLKENVLTLSMLTNASKSSSSGAPSVGSGNL